MNNFFLNQDPLLNQAPYETPSPILYQHLPTMNVKDNMGELDKALKGLSPAVLERLAQNSRFSALNTSLQASVQQELLLLVKNKLNMDSSIVSNVNEQLSLIEEAKRGVEADKDASLNEMNDYMKNYSHLTFDEYKRMKSGEPIETKKKK